MNRSIKISRSIKDIPDPILDVILKYAKTPQELYMESKDFRTVLDLVIFSNESSYFIEIINSNRAIVIPFHNIEEYLKDDHSTLKNINQVAYYIDMFLSNIKEDWMKDIDDLIMSEYHSIMSRKGYIFKYIHIDNIHQNYQSSNQWCTLDNAFKEEYENHKEEYEKLTLLADTYYERLCNIK